MRFVVIVLGLCALRSFAAAPPELEAALKDFHSEPPRAWSFTQTTIAEGKSTVERCNAARPEFDRWTLVQKDGRTPTADELKDYYEGRSRRSRTGTAPKLAEQLDLTSVETVTQTSERATYRCRLRPGEARDQTAPHLRATIVLHRPTRTIESVELASVEPFAPTLGVKIAELKTVMTYALPAGDTPSLPQKVTTRIRGRAFIFKSLDGDMTVTFSDYAKAGKK
jgi:hypothetical protein